MGLKIKDIAEAANVSASTVSLVLNNKPGISDETRQKVLKLVEEMGYSTNLLSKPAFNNQGNIRFMIYKKHGFVVSDTPFFSALMEGIDQETRNERYNLVVSYVNECDTNKSEMLRILAESSPDGIILLATEMLPDDLHTFNQLNIPFVALDNYFNMEKVDAIAISNIHGAYEATKYLIDMNHKKIGYLHSSIGINNFDQRKEGYTKALSDRDIKLNKKFIYCLEPTMEGAYNDMHKILQLKPSLPTALFADNDIIAFGAIKALKEHGLRIPEDISIIGFDDMPFCEMIEPALTTIKVNKQNMGMVAVRRLVEKIEADSEGYLKVEVGTELIIRRSVMNV